MLTKAARADFLANAVVGLVVAYVAMVAGLRVIHTLNAARWEWLAQPQFVLTLAAGVAIAWGLALRKPWAWWAALAAAAWKLFHLGWWMRGQAGDAIAAISGGAGVQALLLLAIMVILLVPGVRRMFFRRAPP